ncbi:MAG: hypothetical protein JO093_05200 [Acidobacteria bacterium]|nr:hypothetical protein [Acidobacteriota bacterium]MBV9069891.1 hypothetical protein [Acidobacteriota bacterium]MBV9184992.1 hypothetical protein [Acidobacteriota bacterium]
MTTKSELSAANRELIAENRLTIGDPPSAEEVLAYTSGGLAPDQEARIRERLMAYPELVRALTTPFPEGAEADHPDYLSDHEFARHWKALQKRRQRPDGVPRYWRAVGAIAAALAVVLGGLLWRAEVQLRQPQAVWQLQDLYPDGQRGIGGSPNTVTANGESYLLVPSLGSDLAVDQLRAEIVDAVNPSRPIWIGKAVPRTPNGSFVILVPRESLKPGTYRLVVYGITGERQEPLNSYTLRVPER